MPRTEEDNIKIRNKRWRQLLDAALKLFAVRGLTATKISDIATEAGLSHGLIYHYFNSKEEIFTELVKEAVSYSKNAYKKAASAADKPLEKIRALTDIFITDGYNGRGVNYFLLIIEASTSDSVPSEARDYIKDNYEFNMNFLIPIIIKGQRGGEIIEGDPEKLANAFMAMIRGLALIYTDTSSNNTFPNTDIVMNIFTYKQHIQTNGSKCTFD